MDYFFFIGSALDRFLDTLLGSVSSFLPSPYFLGGIIIVLVVGAYYMLKA